MERYRPRREREYLENRDVNLLIDELHSKARMHGLAHQATETQDSSGERPVFVGRKVVMPEQPPRLVRKF